MLLEIVPPLNKTEKEFEDESAVRFLKVRVDPLVPVKPIAVGAVGPVKVNEFTPLGPFARVSALPFKLIALVVVMLRELVPVPSIFQV
jgi:hypothetical protein